MSEPTNLDTVQDQTHSRSGQFGPIIEREIIKHLA